MRSAEADAAPRANGQRAPVRRYAVSRSQRPEARPDTGMKLCEMQGNRRVQGSVKHETRHSPETTDRASTERFKTRYLYLVRRPLGKRITRGDNATTSRRQIDDAQSHWRPPVRDSNGVDVRWRARRSSAIVRSCGHVWAHPGDATQTQCQRQTKN